MPAYKDKNNNTWFVKTYIRSFDGKRKSTTKRGFKTKRDASTWETELKSRDSGNLDITLGAFVDIYFENKKSELKDRSIINKKYMINRYIIPFFGNQKLNEIMPWHIIEWQNTMEEKGFSQTYLRSLQNQLTALFTHASNIYGLKDNPCSRVRKMGKSNANRIDFWTKDEYGKFINLIDSKDRYFCVFEILFWTGIRIGELLALTKDDIDFDGNRIDINKTYYRVHSTDIITEPKTEKSIRKVDIPRFLTREISEYYERNKENLISGERLFPIVQEAVQHKLKNVASKANVKKIRVHDLRHSHVAYLINQGVEPFIIKERLGHTDIRMTLNTYGHLYPNKQREIAEMLNVSREYSDG